MFDVLKQSGKAREVLTQLQQVEQVLEKDSPDLKTVLAHPRIPGDRKAELVKTVFGPTVSKETLQFLDVLARRERFDKLPGIIVVLDEMVLAAEGKARAVVTSAVPLEEDQKQAVLHKLGTMTGKWIDLTLNVDPKLIGGVVIQVGDRLIDGSVRTQLEQLREGLKAVRIG
jgi:F-type H+-transporting ATPase subunit delta